MSDAATIAKAEHLAERGAVDEALALLTAAARAAPDDDRVEAALLNLRHSCVDRVDVVPTDGVGDRVQPDRFPDERIPEVLAADLTADDVASALQHHGALLVRGLVTPDQATAIRETIDRTFAAAERRRGRPLLDTSPDFVPFQPLARYEFGPYERAFAAFGSGVLGVDSPRAMFQMIEALDASGVRDVINAYLGERAAFSVKKTTLRRTEPGSVAGWHQDGAFLGMDTKALNIWTALTPAGVDAPGLDVFARHFDHLVPMGGDGIYDWSVSDATAESLDTTPVVRPTFEAGDALLFDHMTLHRTGVDPGMTSTRYAIEMWFFALSTFPTDQIPLLL